MYFLKSLADSRSIRNRLIECFERASSPGVQSAEDQDRLLTFIVIGGGPTSIEFASELYDFLKHDVTRLYPELRQKVKVKVVEASGHILGSFSENLIGYVETLFKNRHIEVISNTAVNEMLGDGK